MEFCPRTIIALDIGGTSIGYALVCYVEEGVCPEVVSEGGVPTLSSGTPLQTVFDVIDQVLQDADQDIDAIGIGTRGYIRLDGSVAIDEATIMPGWTGTALASEVQAHCGLPCAVLNDVHSYALGEARWGAARAAHSAAVVAIGTGIGGALVIDGALERGANGFASEWSHVPCVYAQGIPCVCGGVSHLQSAAAGMGISERYLALTGRDLSARDIAQLANDGQHEAVQIIREAGLALGEAIVGWVSMLDLDMVCLAGSVIKAGPVWQAGFDEAIAPVYQRPGKQPDIRQCALGGHAAFIGAAEHALDTCF